MYLILGAAGYFLGGQRPSSQGIVRIDFSSCLYHYLLLRLRRAERWSWAGLGIELGCCFTGLFGLVFWGRGGFLVFFSTSIALTKRFPRPTLRLLVFAMHGIPIFNLYCCLSGTRQSLVGRRTGWVVDVGWQGKGESLPLFKRFRTTIPG